MSDGDKWTLGHVCRRVDGHWTGVPEGRWTGVPERVDVCYHLFFRQSLSAVKVYSYPSGLMRGATYQSTDLTLFSLQLLQNMWDIIALIPTIPAFENVKPHCPSVRGSSVSQKCEQLWWGGH